LVPEQIPKQYKVIQLGSNQVPTKEEVNAEWDVLLSIATELERKVESFKKK
jgi:hypothetical protein